MKNLVSTAKMLLIERATEVYTDRRADLPLKEYITHYQNLGELIDKIDGYIYLSSIIDDIESDKFSSIGLFGQDEDIADFLKDLYESI